MPDPERELEIARWVSLYSERFRGRHLGDPALNDDGSAEFLFDVRFDSAEPPVALEVTSIVDPHFIATARIADPIAEELTQIAIDEGLGRWYVEVVAGTPLRPIKEAILAAIKEDANLPAGVLNVSQADDGEPGVVIGTWLSAGASAIPGFTSELHEAIQANVTKLAQAAGFERHLAVDLRALRASDPSRSPAPHLPAELDVLWVIKTSVTQARSEPIAWWSTGGEWSFSHDWWL
jgi:hypothetical protein